ncbi:hypothetical protein POL68_13670 [Stigmatella sp. ncwal1]|uniref:MoaD/ThiS family protein n=1 Tax=Stigmatella ashevillensis TaxID=2995309 RepID=A0ABT5D8R3_9BACT|nr:hypothetical protein [Stigmatella ashevillena]MDC0709513.1 hypothetical protein [Stigmatella ashevillena]
MARALDITVVLSPVLRNLFDGRLTVSLSLPSTAQVGDVVESLLNLYPRSKALLAGDRENPSGRVLHFALALGAQGLAAGQKVFLFAPSRYPGGKRAGLDG